MSEELLDEVTSINSIYDSTTLQSIDHSSILYALILPSQPDISLRLEFPPDYPNAPPSILGTQSVGDHHAKGQGQQLVDVVRTVLAEIYSPGAPCVFDLIEEAGQKLQQLGLDQQSEEAEQQQAAQGNGQHPSSSSSLVDISDQQHQSMSELEDPPPWIISDVVTEKKSIFIGRSAAVTSVDQAKQYLGHLLETDKRVAKASHNITAWRIRGENGVQYQDCDDDGETAAGGRVLHLLELMGAWDVMVVVTRWYGGVHLGPDRFRLINQAARDAVVKGDFTVESGKVEKEAGKKKGKK